MTLATCGMSLVLLALAALELSEAPPGASRTGLLVCLLLLSLVTALELAVRRLSQYLALLALRTVVSLAAVMALDAQGPLVTIILMTVFVLSVVIRLPPRHSVPICVAVMLVPVLRAAILGHPPAAPLETLGVELGFLLLAQQAIRYREGVVQTGQQLRRERESVNNLTAANDSLLRALPELKEESAEKERLRITRDLHDTLGYSMTNIVMIMNAAQYLIESDPGKVREYCLRAKELASSTMDETRTTLYKLREIGRRTPDNPAIFFQKLCRDFEEATGVVTECHAGDLGRSFPRRVFDPLLRTVQVAFINALKHGKATQIRLFLWIGDDVLTMKIWNSVDRVAADPAALAREGIGLAGVRERLNEIEGALETAYVADGFSLVVRIPRRELQDGPDPGSDRG